MNNQETYHNFTYNTKCNIWRISFDNRDKEYALKVLGIERGNDRIVIFTH